MKENKMSDSSSTHGKGGKNRLLRNFVEKMRRPRQSAQVGSHVLEDNLKFYLREAMRV